MALFWYVFSLFYGRKDDPNFCNLKGAVLKCRNLLFYYYEAAGAPYLSEAHADLLPPVSDTYTSRARFVSRSPWCTVLCGWLGVSASVVVTLFWESIRTYQ